MDLDAVLARRPEVALVDELAHTNVPGSGRHEKRWQDVLELLEAGIAVITTVNVQHLESIADAVEQITGARVRERVPDWVVRKADQLELIDSSPDQLRRRMLHGNIYPPEKVQQALTHFFRTENLVALRELALRFVADETEEELLDYLQSRNPGAVWDTAERIMVAVTGAPGRTTWCAAPPASRRGPKATLLQSRTWSTPGRAPASARPRCASSPTTWRRVARGRQRRPGTRPGGLRRATPDHPDRARGQPAQPLGGVEQGSVVRRSPLRQPTPCRRPRDRPAQPGDPGDGDGRQLSGTVAPDMEDVSGDNEVVVVGAGLAGLVAAWRLTQAGVSTTVLEARDRVGGRLLNASVSPTEVVEMGGQFVGPGQDRVLALIAELGLSTFPTYDTGRHVFEYDNRIHHYRRVPRLSPLGLLDVGVAILRLDRAARTLSPDEPWAAPRASEWDALTAESLIRRFTTSRLGRTTLRMFVQTVFACDPDSLSALHLLHYIRACGGFGSLTRTRGGAQDQRVVGGSQRICEELAQKLESGVHTGVPVRRIDWSDDGVDVHSDRCVVSGRCAIVAVPPALAARIDYRPALPADRDQLLQRQPQGNVIKAMAVYPRPWWRARGLSGQFGSDKGPLSATFDNTPPSGAPGVLLCFVEGRHAVEVRRMSAHERRATVLSCLERAFGPEALAVSDYKETDWSAEEWTRGCYGSNLPPGTWTTFGPQLRQPTGPIHWAGTETATRWPSYMEGAVDSGERVASEVMARRRLGSAGGACHSAG